MLSVFSRRFQTRSISIAARSFSSTSFALKENSVKVDTKLLGKLRKETQIQISKAREALQATNNDYDLALKWIEKDLLVSGAKKADKVRDRVTNEGVVSMYTSATQRSASIIKLTCETDFVSNNENFQILAADISKACAEISGVSLQPLKIDTILASNIQNTTEIQNSGENTIISNAINSTIGKLSENMAIKAAFGINLEADALGGNSYISTYAHAGNLKISTSFDPKSAETKKNGKIASIVILHSENKDIFNDQVFTQFAKRLVQQVAGYKPLYLATDIPALNIDNFESDKSSQNESEPVQMDTVFLNMEFMFNNESQSGRSVQQALNDISKHLGSQVTISSIAYL
ncbi:Elongation factor Ts, mitochondrial [Smittium culicis]|uniref:Elongation factor Ts, mitochondrial n=1 Tax=Smittium culicis TaxID=133412 RepID=A0A1R1XVU1_9FUNG|nr:Elongation factor Ts, mitochondrial [Smittium culicis]